MVWVTPGLTPMHVQGTALGVFWMALQQARPWLRWSPQVHHSAWTWRHMIQPGWFEKQMVSGEMSSWLSLKEHTWQTANLLVGTVMYRRQQGLKEAHAYAHYNGHSAAGLSFVFSCFMLMTTCWHGIIKLVLDVLPTCRSAVVSQLCCAESSECSWT